MAATLRETVREDGLRIITKRMSNTKRVRVVVRANVGSAYDPLGQEGLAHFFEHMAFKGTQTRSASDIGSLIGRYFLRYSASTGKLHIEYWGETVYLRFQEISDVLFDIYLHPVFPEDEIEKEKGVICNEIAEAEDDDNDMAFFALNELLWRDNPQKRDSLGTPESVGSISRDMLFKTHKSWHIPSNTVIIGTGKIDHDVLVENAYGVFPFSEERVEYKKWEDETLEPLLANEKIIERKERKSSLIVLGCKIPSFDDRERNALIVLNSMLGKGRASLLWQEIRENKGFAYSVSSDFWTVHCQLGYLFVSRVETLPETADEVKQIMTDVVCNHSLDEKHFERQKQVLQDGCLVVLEDLENWQRVIASRILAEGRDLSFLNGFVRKQRQMLSELDFDKVIALRERFLTPERLACVIIKPV